MNIVGRDSSPIRFLRPVYEAFLWVASRREGVPWLINGEVFRIDPRERRRLGHDYEREVAILLKERIRLGMTFVDVGANVGAYVLQAARLVGPTGRVIAFEPNPLAQGVLKRHVEMNGFIDRVTIVPVAVGSEIGTATLFAESADGMTRLERANPNLTKASPLATTVDTLDRYFDGSSEDPDAVLIDVEGFETAVLIGARTMVKRARENMLIIVEMHPAAWQPPHARRQDIEALLNDLGVFARPLTGQLDALAEHGNVELAPCALRPVKPK